MSSVRNELGEEVSKQIAADLDAFGDLLAEGLTSMGLGLHASPLFQPWGVVCGLYSNHVVAVFLEVRGVPPVMYLDVEAQGLGHITPEMFAAQIAGQFGARLIAALVLDPPGTPTAVKQQTLRGLADDELRAVERNVRLGRLGDLTGITHLEAGLRAFLDDHPDPAKNVFVMMRFENTAEFRTVHETIVATLAERGLHGVRADDRAYHQDLWANVEIYLTGCQLGIAVFEDFETRDHNPNVALELGYMKAKQRRCLILKERTLPAVPTDIVGSLYQGFDKFNIADTVKEQVVRWVEVDLGIR